MSRPKQFGTKTPVLAGTALLLATFAWSTLAPVRAMPATAQRFISYMNKIDSSGQPLSLMDKITYSLVLAGPNPSHPRNARI